MHPEMRNHYCELFKKLGGTKVGLSWMNFGSAADESNEFKLDKNDIRILNGAIDSQGLLKPPKYYFPLKICQKIYQTLKLVLYENNKKRPQPSLQS